MKARNGKHGHGGAMLNSVAESIGAALGTIAAKADAAQKALAHNSVVREAKKLTGKTKRSARKTARRASRAVASAKRSKVAKAGRRGVRRAAAAVKRAARRR